MFKIEYAVVNCIEDGEECYDFLGEEGYIKIWFNEMSYGDIYPKELYDVMIPEHLFDWIENLAKISNILKERNYVLLSDAESYNTWIEFIRNDDDLEISVVIGDKICGMYEIEYHTDNIEYTEDSHQIVSYKQFVEEVNRVVIEHVKYLIENNPPSIVENLSKSILFDIYNKYLENSI